jgi:hypothetical protein
MWSGRPPSSTHSSAMGLVAFDGQRRAAQRGQVVVGQREVAGVLRALAHEGPAARVVGEHVAPRAQRIELARVGGRHAFVRRHLAAQARGPRVVRRRHRRVARRGQHQRVGAEVERLRHAHGGHAVLVRAGRVARLVLERQPRHAELRGQRGHVLQRRAAFAEREAGAWIRAVRQGHGLGAVRKVAGAQGHMDAVAPAGRAAVMRERDRVERVAAQALQAAQPGVSRGPRRLVPHHAQGISRGLCEVVRGRNGELQVQNGRWRHGRHRVMHGEWCLNLMHSEIK